MNRQPSVARREVAHRRRCSGSLRGVASVHQKRCATFACLALLLLAAGSAGQAQTLPDLITYSFSLVESNTLPGTSSTCSGAIAAADQIGNLALVALFYQNGCYTDGTYNNNDYPVEHGTVSAPGGAGNLDAYVIHEPLHKATQFLASQHAMYYRFPTIENYTLYSFVNGSLAKVADIPAAAITNTADFIPVPNSTNPITVSTVIGSVTYVFAPSATRVSSYTSLAPGVEGARVASTPFGDVLKYRYTVAGTPFDTVLDYPYGPGDFANTYSDPRRYFLVRNGNAGLGVVWQDQVNSSLNLTWFGTDRISPTTVALANPQAQFLACATGDDSGNVYYLTVQPGNGAPNNNRSATLTKAGPDGTVLVTTALDTSGAGLNMVEFYNIATMKYLNGDLAVMLGRIMLQTPDGLNHQGGIAVVFNATTLAVETNWGQTSGHSWDDVLISNTNGQFVGLDLGDNYPRGINLHKFTGANLTDRVISTYKTAHGTTPQSPSGITYPVYTAISTNGITYYEWSNDNFTYTELGGLAQTSLGYAAIFAGEPSPAGLLIDNSRVGGVLNDPRNIGFITVREDFQNASGSGLQDAYNEVVTDDLVVTSGIVETNGFYDFGGLWHPQRNAGVVWLTQYPSLRQNATRLKMTTRADGSLQLLWELWTSSAYVTTKGMTVSQNGTVINAETDLGSLVRLHRGDDPYGLNGDIYLAAGSKVDTTIELNVIQPASPSGVLPHAFTAAEPGLGLDLQGSFLYAVAAGATSAPGLIGNAKCTTDNVSGVTITTPGSSLFTVNGWANPNFGATTDDVRLAQAMSSIRWTAAPGILTVNLAGLQVGTRYQLQLMFIETLDDRVFDVAVNGTTIVPAFRFLDYGPWGTAIVIPYVFTATSANALIQLGGGTGGDDNNPTLSAFTLEALAPAVSTPPVNFKVNGSIQPAGGAFQLSFSNLSGLAFTVLGTTNPGLPLSSWTVLGAPVESPSGQYQFSDLQAPNNPQRFYRVRSP